MKITENTAKLVATLTPLSYICSLDKTGKTPASISFKRATNIPLISQAFIIAAIATGHTTVDMMLSLRRFDQIVITRNRSSGYYTTTATSERHTNHKPILIYTLTEKGQAAWEQIINYTTPRIQKIKQLIA